MLIKSIILVFLFTNLFIILNTIGDAINFYRVFRWYKNMPLWHVLKYGWLFCAVMVGYYLNDLLSQTGGWKVSLFFILWFCLLRLILHEALMSKWRKE